MICLRKTRRAGPCGALPCAPRPPTFSPVPVTEQRLVLTSRTHGSDRPPIVAVAVVHEVIARIEVEVPRVARAARVERTRPVVAVAACEVETAIVAGARSGQEEIAAVACGEESSVHPVLLRPGYGRVVVELLPFFLRGQAPPISTVGSCRVVLGQ